MNMKSPKIKKVNQKIPSIWLFNIELAQKN